MDDDDVFDMVWKFGFWRFVMLLNVLKLRIREYKINYVMVDNDDEFIRVWLDLS